MLLISPEVLDTLIDWVLEGLDRDKAMAQGETAYKVRHLKMGIRLTAALCSCDSYIAFRMMVRSSEEIICFIFINVKKHFTREAKCQQGSSPILMDNLSVSILIYWFDDRVMEFVLCFPVEYFLLMCLM
jgi:hypothetical protein